MEHEGGGGRARELAAPIAGAVACALGAAAALGWASARAAQGPAPLARPAVWASDRDANLVYGLDARLLVVRAVPLRAPLELEMRPDGGAWVVSAVQGDPLGAHQLARLLGDGTIAARAPVAPPLDLALDEHGRAVLVVLAPAGEQVAVHDATAAPAWSLAWPGARCAAARGQRVLVGTATGDLVVLDAAQPGPPLRVATFGGIVADVAPGPTAASWWVLDAAGAGRLALLDGALGVVWSRTVGLHALHLAACAGEERVWIADTTAPHARRFGPGGVLEIDRSDLLLGGLDRAAALRGGGALLAAPGALLALDGHGRNAPGQGGFDFLVDVAAAP